MVRLQVYILVTVLSVTIAVLAWGVSMLLGRSFGVLDGLMWFLSGMFAGSLAAQGINWHARPVSTTLVCFGYAVALVLIKEALD